MLVSKEYSHRIYTYEVFIGREFTCIVMLSRVSVCVGTIMTLEWKEGRKEKKNNFIIRGNDGAV